MANPYKGEVDVVIKGQPYRLTFTTNAICEIEDKIDRGWFDVASEMAAWAPPLDAKGNPKRETEAEQRKRMGRLKMSLVRTIFWGMLREHHPGMTLNDAGRLMEAIEEDGGALALINRVFERSMPESTGRGDTKNPPEPGAATNANGTGQASAGIGAG